MTFAGLTLQAAVIRQDSILELSVTLMSGPAPPLSRSVSRDAGTDASGDAMLLRRQVELLNEEVTRLRLKGEGGGARKGGNGKTGDDTQDKQVGRVNQAWAALLPKSS